MSYKKLFVEQSSTIECYHHPPGGAIQKMETIASKQACFKKQTNTFK
jgi:hypothetical protein